MGNQTNMSLITKIREGQSKKRKLLATSTHKVNILNKGFPGGSDGKESACNAGDPGLIPGSGRSPRERTGYPLQYSCLENSMDRGIRAGAKSMGSQSRTQLSD